MSNHIETRQLIAFTTLAKTGSFTKTAKHLFLTQSAISHSVKALETDLNCKLFTRIGKKIHLTLAGEQLYVAAEKILHAMSNARSQVENATEWGKGRLRIGASTTVCQYILPTVLREFKQSFPECKIVIEPGDTPDLIEKLHSNDADVAITLAPDNHLEYNFHNLFQDDLSFLVSAQHPWAKNGKADRKALKDEQFILQSKGSYTFRSISKYFKDLNFELVHFMEPGSIESIKELVKIGMGISVVAPWVAQKEIEDGSLVSIPLGKKSLERSWGFTYLKSKRLSLAEETFLGLSEVVTQNLSLKYSGFRSHKNEVPALMTNGG